ncbi:hypothetical protein CHS0354_012606 [Potamilus streckersoni]|uniref:GBD/FH3 domain-containing protein n=1 Tax=Potamilus streckersoni TaxID=2493646 RepID=A0AAE0SY84_9BIVA|nr:hypothetical protein CHS0354_012606 [Potamilus streckersoni]
MMAAETRQMPDTVNNTTMELQQDLARSTPEQCVALTHSVPSVQMYYALRLKLERCGEAWLQSFLDLGGLDSLLNSLDQLTGRGFTSFLDAILQLDCISCVRAVLNSNVGLDFMVNSEGNIKKFAIALNTNNTLPKKHVFEILSALCAYSNNGYRQVLDALSYVKKEADLPHRFSIIVNELKVAESAQHQTSVLTLINCIINCTPEIMERIRIRNEFIFNLMGTLDPIMRIQSFDWYIGPHINHLLAKTLKESSLVKNKIKQVTSSQTLHTALASTARTCFVMAAHLD